MNPGPEDSEDLIQFLQRHRSIPPAAAPELEDRIIQALPRRSSVSRPWALAAAGMAAGFVGLLVAQPARSPSVEAEVLEAFMESNWSGVVEGTPPSEMADYLALVEPNSNQ